MEENKDLDIQEMGIISSDFIKVADKLKTATQKITENKFESSSLNDNLGFVIFLALIKSII